jgi:Protein of unknown function (DUF2809).
MLAAEVCIALFVHDTVIRPYIGDILAAVLVYCTVRVFWHNPPKLLAFYVWMFAVAVELVQLFGIVQWLGLGENRLIAVIAGGTFDFVDIALYAVGAGMMFGIQLLEQRYKNTDGGY